jgi:ferritin
MNNRVLQAMEEQIGEEMYSAYLYLAIAQWCGSKNLKGFAHWFTKQSGEEFTHAMKFIKHINDRGGFVKFSPIKAPTFEGNSALDSLQASLTHEKFITSKIHKLYQLALEQKDFASHSLLQWFINEQVEEEQGIGDLIARLIYTKESPTATMFLDAQMGKRE